MCVEKESQKKNSKMIRGFLLCNEKHCMRIIMPRSQPLRIPRPSGAALQPLIKIDEAAKLAASSVRSILKIPSGSHA